MPSHPEQGRELKTSELLSRIGFVVIIGREDRDIALTAWVQHVDDGCVAFLLGAVNTTLLCKRDRDDKLTDDTGRRMLVYEFLGEV
jgi:hypothetical protein